MNRNSLVIVGAVAIASLGWSLHCQAGDIHNYAALGNVEKVKALLKSHPELVDSTDDHDRKPLHYAAQRGHLEIVELLLANKADVNARVQERSPAGLVNWTPLHLAAERGRVAVVELLLSKGADIEAKDVSDRTPFFLATVEDQLDVMKVLLDHKANINVRDKNGKTPLIRAREAEYRDAIEFLRANGAQE